MPSSHDTHRVLLIWFSARLFNGQANMEIWLWTRSRAGQIICSCRNQFFWFNRSTSTLLLVSPCPQPPMRRNRETQLLLLGVRTTALCECHRPACHSSSLTWKVGSGDRGGYLINSCFFQGAWSNISSPPDKILNFVDSLQAAVVVFDNATIHTNVTQ